MGGKRVRERRAGADPLVDIGQHRAKDRRVDAPLEQIERLHQRHAGAQQRGQFLVEDQKFAAGNAGAAGQAERKSADSALRPQ